MVEFPRLTIVIPHLNEPEDLGRCLQSLDVQRRDLIPFEVIVVDNGSRQSPHTVCSSFQNIRLEHESTPGPGPARNRGAILARAGIVAFIDADCIADAGWVRGIVGYFDQNMDVDIVAGDIAILRNRACGVSAVEVYESVFSYRVQLFVERDHYAATGNMAVRTEVFRKVGPFGGITIAEDRDWGRRATAMGFRLSHVPEIRIFTPPCETFDELAKRWDRAIAHDFEDFHLKGGGILRWVLRSALVAISPVISIQELCQSSMISGVQERLLAFSCLVRIRLYRAGKMLALPFRRNPLAVATSWNRQQLGDDVE
jgi:glycosyltransferase involved in cell wall biosynthesis